MHADVGGKPYTLRPDFNAVCELETLINKSFEAVLVECAEGRMNGLRACVWCLLQSHHGDEIKTLKDAGDWITNAGGVEKVYELVKSTLDANDDPAPQGAQTGRPRRARGGGTGARSSSRRVTSA
jgi:hypothetical protein